MVNDSIQLRPYSCFGDHWVGFDSFTPITVIIGRNNTGKSRLLGLVELLTGEVKLRHEYDTRGVVQLEEGDLRTVFPENLSRGQLGGNHWNDHGRHLVGVTVSWSYNGSGKFEIRLPDDAIHRNGGVQDAREAELVKILRPSRVPLTGKRYRHLLADRDIRPEKPDNELVVRPDGGGSTNTVRRYITSSSLPEDLIQTELLSALQHIFGRDGDFDRIEIRQHDESDGESDLWEIFLGEPRKGLIPLSSSGSGLKTVFLVLLNLLVVPVSEQESRCDYVFAFEELENNLHPALLRRLFDFIFEYVQREGCHVFLTTHSSVALDFFSTKSGSQLIHVSHDGESARAKSVSAHFEKVELVRELGARASDLLQANGVIWVEGPSDRIYINRFIEIYGDGELREGRDYQCAHYGGSVLAKVEFADPDEAQDEFANLLRLNSNVAVVCDGDRIAPAGAGSRIKSRTQRIKHQVESIDGGFLWITEAKEIENYIPGVVWSAVYEKPGVPDPQRYDAFPTSNISEDDFVRKHVGRRSFDKCEFATAVAASTELDREVLDERFDMKAKMEELVAVIRSWND